MSIQVQLRVNCSILAVMCESLPSPPNGRISYSSGSLGYQTMANYMCNVGYGLIGDRSRTCVGSALSPGEWTGSQPICTRKTFNFAVHV